MILTTDQILEDARSDLFDRADVDDSGHPRDTLWSDADLLRYLNSAAARLASDTLSLRRRLTFEVSAYDPIVRVPYDEIIEVLAASFSTTGISSRPRQLVQFNIDEGIIRDDYGVLGIYAPDLTAGGSPSHFTRDYDHAHMRIYPVPHMAGTLVLLAVVLPGHIYAGMPLPFSSFQDRDLLLMWMKKLAYEKQDADTLDLTRAKSFENEYRETVRSRASEVDRIRRDGGILTPRA